MISSWFPRRGGSLRFLEKVLSFGDKIEKITTIKILNLLLKKEVFL